MVDVLARTVCEAMNVGYRDPCLVVVVVDGQDYFIRLSAF